MSYGAIYTGYPTNICVTSAGLSGLSGAATTFSTGGVVTYSINGVALTRAAFSGAATPTTDFNTGAAFRPLLVNQGSVFVWGLDAAGNARVVQGSIEALDSAGNFLNAPQFPTIPDTMCPIAYCVIRAGSTYAGTGWRFGSDNWNTTGIAAITARNLLDMPIRPQTS